MRFSRSLLLFPAMFCLLGLMSAQQPQTAPQREISRVYYLTPKAGSEMQFEKALQEHAQFHAQRKDPWRWDVRFTETGRRTGEYIVITSGHQWKDFDNPAIPNSEDDQHFGSTVGPHVGSWSSIFLQTRPDLSRMQQMPPAAPLMSVTFFYLKYGKTAQFEDTIKQINAALDQSNAPRMSTWSEMVGSGRNAAFLLVTPRENWAAFAPMGGPAMRARLEQALGAEKTNALFASLEACVDSTESKITSARADLGYGTAKK